MLQYLEPEVNIVCGTATGFCPSGCAFDSAKFGIKTKYWVGASKGITEGEEEATHQALEKAGIEVSNSFTGQLGPEDMLLDKAFLTPVGANQTYEVLERNTGKYALIITNGGDLPLAKAEEAARCLRTFLTSDLSKTHLSADEKANLVAHVTVIDNVIEKYNDSVRNSGLIWFFTIVLAVLTLGMYILRDKLIRPTIANLLPADFKNAAALVSARKETAEVTATRKEAFDFLKDHEDFLSGDESLLLNRLSLADQAPVVKTDALVKSFAELKLDTIETVTLVESAGDTMRYASHPVSVIAPEVKGLIDNVIKSVPGTLVIEAKLKDGTNVRFGKQPGEVSLETFAFASDTAVNAACAKVIEKYKEAAEVAVTRKKALEILSTRQSQSQQDKILIGLLRSQLNWVPMPKTQSLVEGVAKHKLDTITSVVVRARQTKEEIPVTKGPIFDVGMQVEYLQKNSGYIIEATCADDSKVTFGTGAGELSLELLQFASNMALNAECTKVVAQYGNK